MGYSIYAGHDTDPITSPRRASAPPLYENACAGATTRTGMVCCGRWKILAQCDSSSRSPVGSRANGSDGLALLRALRPPRLTVCPICARGRAISVGRVPGACGAGAAQPRRRARAAATDDAAVEILLVCPQCDEPSRPGSTAAVRNAVTTRAPASICDRRTSNRCPTRSCWSSAARRGLVAMLLYLRWLFP